jgi:hypothetical protein
MWTSEFGPYQVVICSKGSQVEASLVPRNAPAPLGLWPPQGGKTSIADYFSELQCVASQVHRSIMTSSSWTISAMNTDILAPPSKWGKNPLMLLSAGGIVSASFRGILRRYLPSNCYARFIVDILLPVQPWQIGYFQPSWLWWELMLRGVGQIVGDTRFEKPIK